MEILKSPEDSKIEQKQKKYYNKIASTYDQHFADKYALEYRYGFYDNILRETDVRGLKVLDAMCGGGQNTGYFISKDCDVCGIDISEEQCKHYKNRFPNLKVQCGSVLNTNFPDNSFDLIVTESLHHLHPEVDNGIQELYRILKPNGRLLIWEPCARSIFDYLRKLWYKKSSKYFEDNEESIDLEKLLINHHDKFELKKRIYGGNIAYLFVFLSMHFGISVKFVKYYAKLLIFIEKLLTPLQSRLNALWVLALLEKKP